MHKPKRIDEPLAVVDLGFSRECQTGEQSGVSQFRCLLIRSSSIDIALTLQCSVLRGVLPTWRRVTAVSARAVFASHLICNVPLCVEGAEPTNVDKGAESFHRPVEDSTGFLQLIKFFS
jgi:hypothetical protein